MTLKLKYFKRIYYVKGRIKEKMLGLYEFYQLLKDYLPLVVSIFCFCFFLLLPVFFRKEFKFKIRDFVFSLSITSLLYFLTIYVFDLSRIDYILDAFKVCNNNRVIFGSIFAALIEITKRSVLSTYATKILIVLVKLLIVLNIVLISIYPFNFFKTLFIKFILLITNLFNEQKSYITKKLTIIKNNIHIYNCKYNC